MGERGPLDTRVMILLVLLAYVGVLVRERALGPHIGVSVVMVVLAATIPLAGPHGAVIVGLTAQLLDFRQWHWRKWSFNAVMAGTIGGLGGWSYVALGGQPGTRDDLEGLALLGQVGLPLLLAYGVMTLTNALAVAAMSAVMRGTRVLDFAIRVLRGVGWAYVSHVTIAFLFVVLWGPAGLGAVAAAFVLGPLFIAHWAIGREAQARREHQETVTTFVAALEQSDASTAGHSARVAALAEALGGVIGIHGKAAESLRYAALLHDIGLVAARPSRDPEDLDEAAYLTSLSTHAEAGVEVLRGLDFLADATPAIAHHHERWDGRGYPAGLAGEDIPEAARIIAVADAYDALTVAPKNERLTAEEALLELEGRAGTQLDPAVVEALRTLASRPRGLPVPERPVPAPDAPVRALPDHDHPRISDAFAQWQPESVGRLL
ncbi:HD-GYP domain-containing protein [Ornithinimicrobium sufpigmenti]|uniref:HD-GYP domain-containing protein n=1 Tax=Ornithinimicrobium sufpigmenti TaxID=2508882 RepID=UPI001036BF44|nr:MULTISPECIES: HD domain-containing phosphohydrolase [unclassified Ornithinimicrobium]